MSWHVLGALGFAVLGVVLFISMVRRLSHETRIDFRIGRQIVSVVGPPGPPDIDRLARAIQSQLRSHSNEPKDEFGSSLRGEPDVSDESSVENCDEYPISVQNL